MICFQSRSLSGCIFVLTNNTNDERKILRIVVICFQKIVSLFWRTTHSSFLILVEWLWFAFKKLYLCSDEQPGSQFNRFLSCCDLLSKNCIFVLTNNYFFSQYACRAVVICFQKIVSLFWRTTFYPVITYLDKLWFAFKKLYLCSDEQHATDCCFNAGCCDLLSKNCIFVLTNNSVVAHITCFAVVICFQKIVSLFWRTT